MQIRKLTVALILLFAPLLIHAEWVNTGSAKATKPTVDVQSNIESSTVQIQLQGFYLTRVKTTQGEYYKTEGPELTPLLEKDAPDLSKIAVSLIVPDDANMQMAVTVNHFTDFQNIQIAPSKGNLYRNINPDEIDLHFGSVYGNNAFYPGQNAALQNPFILRDFRGQTIWFYPFQYNPVTKVLRVFTDVTITLNRSTDVAPALNVLQRQKPLQKIDRDFSLIYQTQFRNAAAAINYIPVEEEGEMLIISYPSFISALDSFVDWKIKKGIAVTVVDVTTIGTNAAQLQSYIDMFYLNHNLKYILLVGDAQQIPTHYVSGGASDPSYGYIVGNDSYAEVFVGRFSAQTIADVQTQVQRTIIYERNPDPGGTWYSKGICVASNQGPGDNNEIDYEHEQVIRAKQLAFTYTDVAELYDGTQGGNDQPGNPTAFMLSTELNSGSSVINYTGHGSQVSFGTTGFSNTDITGLNNQGMLPFIWSVGCVNGEFDTGTCFGEAWLRATQNNEPTGAIAAFMSSINQSWDPPMAGQDEMVDLLVGTHGTIKRTFGGLSVNGCMFMNDKYGGAGFDMTDTWHCFGDPSLNVRTATPFTISASHAPVLNIGADQLLVNCNTDSAFACLSSHGQILATGLIINGSVTLNFPMVNAIDTLFLTITAFNAVPYMMEIPVNSFNGPFVTMVSDAINDTIGNNNQLADYGEHISVDLELRNFGLTDAVNVSYSVSTTNSHVVLLSTKGNAGTIAASAQTNVPGAFSYSVNNIIPDNEIAQFTIDLTDSAGNHWQSVVNHVLRAPALNVYSLIVNDLAGNGNGKLDPGETANLIIRTNNKGHSNSSACMATITSSSPYLTINNSGYSIGVINALGYADAVFNVTLNSNVQIGTLLDVMFNITDSTYSDSKQFYITAGEVLENFETGDFSKFPWQNNYTHPWTITGSTPYQGVYSASTPALSDGDTSTLSIQLNVLSDDYISFYTLVSTELNWDFLQFYIDGTLRDSYSGVQAWTYRSYPVATGIHTFTWSYSKDPVCCFGGSDMVMLDNIHFPPSSGVTAVNEIPTNDESIGIYPNPASDYIHISSKQNGVVIINSADGKVVFTDKLNNGTEKQIDVSALASGMYIVSVQTQDKITKTKFLKR